MRRGWRGRKSHRSYDTSGRPRSVTLDAGLRRRERRAGRPGGSAPAWRRSAAASPTRPSPRAWTPARSRADRECRLPIRAVVRVERARVGRGRPVEVEDRPIRGRLRAVPSQQVMMPRAGLTVAVAGADRADIGHRQRDAGEAQDQQGDPEPMGPVCPAGSSHDIPWARSGRLDYGPVPGMVKGGASPGGRPRGMPIPPRPPDAPGGSIAARLPARDPSARRIAPTGPAITPA